MAATDDMTGVPVGDGHLYLKWAAESLGVIVHHPLRLCSMPGKEERGVFCEQDIPAETIVVSVPWEALLTVDCAESTPFRGLYGRQQGGVVIREDDLLCLLLLYHRHVLAEQSPFWKHVEALPRVYHQTIFYTEGEMELLKGSSLHAVTVQWKSQAESDFRELEELELPATGETTSSTARDALQGFLTKEGYLWALSTVWSRFVSVQRAGRTLKAMAPVFDMFNHDPLSSTVHGFQESNDCLHLVTLQDWPAGSEVRFCYGPLPNSRLLLLHGFCVPDNPFEAVELWATMEANAPRYAEKVKILALNGVDPSSMPFRLSDQGLDPRLLPTLRVQRATDAELEIAKDAKWGDSLSQRNEAEVCDLLCAALASMLEERGAPSSQPHCNGSCREEPPSDTTPIDASDGSGPIAGGEIAEEAGAMPYGEGGGSGGGDGARWVLPEDRRKAVELLKKGEERVLRLCLERVEAHRLQVEQQLE